MEVARLQLDKIAPSAGARPLVSGRVGVLADSLKAIGLRTPITVRHVLRIVGGRPTPGYEIVAGRHRFEAAKSLDWSEIDAVIMESSAEDAELWEIDENFARAELTDAQRADHHTRRERILISKGIVTTHGGDRKSNGQNVHLKSYAEKTAEDLGVDGRTVRRDLARGKKIEPSVLAEVAGTDLDKGVVLDELAKAPRSQQVALLDEIRQRQESHKVNREVNKVISLTDAQMFAEWIMARTDLNELDTIISWLEGTKPKDVIAALRREAA